MTKTAMRNENVRKILQGGYIQEFVKTLINSVLVKMITICFSILCVRQIVRKILHSVIC